MLVRAFLRQNAGLEAWRPPSVGLHPHRIQNALCCAIQDKLAPPSRWSHWASNSSRWAQLGCPLLQQSARNRRGTITPITRISQPEPKRVVWDQPSVLPRDGAQSLDQLSWPARRSQQAISATESAHVASYIETGSVGLSSKRTLASKRVLSHPGVPYSDPASTTARLWRNISHNTSVRSLPAPCGCRSPACVALTP